MSKKRLPITLILGGLLMVCGLSLMLFFQLRSGNAEKTADATVKQILAFLPEQTPGIPENYTNIAMPVLALENGDYCGLVEIPAFGICLPLDNTWDTDKLWAHPCRFWGSVYDKSLVIGSSGQQFSFCDKIDLGAYVSITDMTGAEYTYTVSRVDRSRHADQSWLLSDKYDLTLFARGTFSLEYIAVRCSLTAQ